MCGELLILLENQQFATDRSRRARNEAQMTIRTGTPAPANADPKREAPQRRMIIYLTPEMRDQLFAARQLARATGDELMMRRLVP